MLSLFLTTWCVAQDTAGPDGADVHRWAVILVGLPGDEAHAKQFNDLSNELRRWLVESLRFPEKQVLRLPEHSPIEAEASPPLTAESIRSTLLDLTMKLEPDDALWLITLGHGSYGGKRAWFHVAGRDPSDAAFAGWLSELRCREQVLWLTHSSSGWMVGALSRPGRIVIAASAADDEPNETEFPHALAAIARKRPVEIIRGQDGRLSVADLYAAVVAEVAERFKNDNRLPTEHAQLDDNGDGKGSETLDEANVPGDKQDGELARATIVPDIRLPLEP